MTPTRAGRQWGLFALLVAGCSCLAGSAIAQPTSASLASYAGHAWTVLDGLPHDSVTAILHGRDGFLWVGTLDGLVRFDGHSFRTYNLIRAAGSDSNAVNALAEDRDGGLWIGTTHGIVRLHAERFTSVAAPPEAPHLFVRTIHITRDGTVWLGTRGNGLFRVRGARLEAAPAGDRHADVLSVAEDAEGGLWVGSLAGLARHAGSNIEGVRFAEPVRDRAVSSVLIDRQGRIWLGTGDGVWRADRGPASDGPTVYIAHRHALAAVAIRVLAEDRTGAVWAGLASGLARILSAQIEREHKGLLSYPNVRALAFDREGGVWAGTDGGGLNRLREASVTIVPAPNPRPGSSVMSVHRDAAGRMWTGANCGGATRWDPEGPRTFTEMEGLPSDCIRSFASHPDGSTWVGTIAGAAAIRGTRVTPVPAAAGRRVMAIAATRGGDVWMGTSGSGVIIVAPLGQTRRLRTTEGLPHDDVRAIMEARDGTVWIGTFGGGLARWDGGRVTTLTRAQGLSNNHVLALLEDRDGTLWVGTNGGGLNRVREGKVAHVTTDAGLPGDSIFSILDDGQGAFWISGPRASFRVTLADLNEVADGRRQRVRAITLDPSTGMASRGFMGGSQPAGAIDRHGRVWLPTLEGIAVADPARLHRATVPPAVRILGIAVDGTPAPPPAPVKVAPGRRTIAIEYTGLSFVEPAQVQFKYRLVGFKDDWVDVGTRRTEYFTGLGPGRYTFEVMAATGDGLWSTEPASVSFVVSPRFYQTAGFLATAGLLGLAVVLGGVRYRERRLRLRAQELKAQVDESLAHIKVLSGLLPICASCKRIRDEHEAWLPVERYIHDHSQASFSHGICPECMAKLYPDEQ